MNAIQHGREFNYVSEGGPSNLTNRRLWVTLSGKILVGSLEQKQPVETWN